MRGFAPRRENDFAGLGAPHLDHAYYIWGFAPNPTRGLFWEKVPETRKNRTGQGIYYQIQIANKAAVGSLFYVLAKQFRLYSQLAERR